MVAFIEAHRDEYGVESICEVLPIAPATYYEHRARRLDSERIPKRAKHDAKICEEILRVWKSNFSVYGAKKVWQQLNREEITVARCTIERLMKRLGLRGAIRGGAFKITTKADEKNIRPPDLVARNFHATRPNELWVADFTYVATWLGFVYVAFVIDVFSRAIVGWRASRSMRSDLPLDALEQALHARPVTSRLVHHSDQGSQYLSIRYTERLAAAGVESSVGSRGDSYDNAMAESIIGLFKAEVIHRRGPWRNLDQVEYAVLEWVDWFNNRRLLEPLDYVPPVEYETAFYKAQATQSAVA
jgi:transposase InsO family protein